LKEQGAVKAMSLDGGSSSGLVYQGQVHYGKFNKDGSPVIRPVKSVLMLLDN
jgi:exopolysaccharide biosynthesis protein